MMRPVPWQQCRRVCSLTACIQTARFLHTRLRESRGMDYRIRRLTPGWRSRERGSNTNRSSLVRSRGRSLGCRSRGRGHQTGRYSGLDERDGLAFEIAVQPEERFRRVTPTCGRRSCVDTGAVVHRNRAAFYSHHPEPGGEG